ncbi:hypothetical protein N4P33_19955 [Streptomyces sp. 15-116A]|uniref:hypothetical protein n=1 Tax=Streptomyces sp. 15-116A TaxID=2259035 RepID=UPI0021B4385A|nr:hypothetical protein [Streptomyces sp. 15-116A]MCT7354411.1 hypothetical protein [Streptomyces sp. 15-116A]
MSLDTATAPVSPATAGPPRPSLTRHPLRGEVLRGFAPVAGSAMLLMLLVALGVSAEQWQGGWAETREHLHLTTVLLGVPLALAAGCWQGGRERRRGTEELLASAARGRTAGFVASALPVALWLAAGYAVAATAAHLATWYCSMGDRPRLATPLTDAAVLVCASLLGQVAGRVVAWRLTAPLLAAAGYVVLGMLDHGNRDTVRYLSPLADGSLTAVPVWWQPLVMVAWTGGLAIAAVLACTARRGLVALLPLAAAGAAGTLLLQTGDGLWRTDPLAHRQVCDTSTTPDICVNARYAEMLPQVRDALSGLTGRLEGVRNVPVRFEDLPGRPGPDEAELPMMTPLGWSVVRGRLTDPREYAWAAGMMLQGGGECDATDPRAQRVHDAVEHFLAPSPLSRYFDEQKAERGEADRAELKKRLAARARLTSMGDEERRAWLSRYFAVRGECDPSVVPAL